MQHNNNNTMRRYALLGNIRRYTPVAVEQTAHNRRLASSPISVDQSEMALSYKTKPALTRYLSILFLSTLTLLACTQSVDNLFHTLMVLWENENFLTSNLLCFFTSVKLCPPVILLSLMSKNNIRINIFHNHSIS